MGEITAICIVGIITLGIYRLFELFVRKSERMVIIEKLGDIIKLSEAKVDLNLPFFQQTSGNWALRISLLLTGIGIGLLLAVFLYFALTIGDIDLMNSRDFQRNFEVVYFASVAVFGGIGLLVAYFIEQKNNRKGN